MRGEYLCPCCGKNIVGKYGDFLCDYCGWDDEFETRGDDEDICNRMSFNEAKKMVQSGKNLVDGGGLPWLTHTDDD